MITFEEFVIPNSISNRSVSHNFSNSFMEIMSAFQCFSSLESLTSLYILIVLFDMPPVVFVVVPPSSKLIT